MKTCSRCKRSLPREEFVSRDVRQPGETRKCSRCRGIDAERNRRFNATTRCGFPRCLDLVVEGTPLCAQHGRTPPPDGQQRQWYSLSCVQCGQLEFGYMTRFERAHLIVPPCPRCNSTFREVNEERQGIGGMLGARVTSSWRDDAA